LAISNCVIVHICVVYRFDLPKFSNKTHQLKQFKEENKSIEARRHVKQCLNSYQIYNLTKLAPNPSTTTKIFKQVENQIYGHGKHYCTTESNESSCSAREDTSQRIRKMGVGKIERNKKKTD